MWNANVVKLEDAWTYQLVAHINTYKPGRAHRPHHIKGWVCSAIVYAQPAHIVCPEVYRLVVPVVPDVEGECSCVVPPQEICIKPSIAEYCSLSCNRL